MTDRTKPSLRCPAPPSDELKKFPSETVGKRRDLWRTVRVENSEDPWWFSSSMAGRFDVDSPNGTCYLAFDPYAAVREVIGPESAGVPIPRSLLDARVLRRLRLPTHKRLADLTAPSSYRYGVTLEISTIVPYDCPQSWAGELHSAGFEGTKFQLRHSPAMSLGVAVFGEEGSRTWDAGNEVPISEAIISNLYQEDGIEVWPVPASASLEILDELP